MGDAVNQPEVAVRIAMWSGPRNISTAMMRSWGNRPDTFVCDEPLYAHYLRRTGLDHPGAEEVIRHHEPDWRKVTDWLTGPVPQGKRIFYQKHMTHHLLPNVDRDWLDRLRHAFLIRDPEAMLISLAAKLERPGLDDTGLERQVDIFRWVRRRTGRVPPVVDARDVLQDPRGTLSLLCGALGVEFDERMLSWPAGRRETDGIWARHWYAAVEASTGFRTWRPPAGRLPGRLAGLLDRCLELHAELTPHRLRPEGSD